ncbi:MAG: ATP synthase F0 subunit B [Terracidiphilus sp.]
MRDRFSHLRFSPRVFGFLFLAVLVAGFLTVAAPRPVVAQESAPAAAAQTSASGTSAPGTAASEAPRSQEEQNKAFLLEGPIVKWTARTFNLTVQTASGIFQIVNFAIIVLLVGVPIVRILPKVFHKRSQTLGSSLKTAREATADANARLSAVEAKLAGLDEEIKKFRAEVERESLEDEARIKATLVEESARIVQAAEQELTVAAAQARRGLRHFAADLAIEQAAKQMVLTPATDRALIDEFVGQVSQSVAGNGKGGQN